MDDRQPRLLVKNGTLIDGSGSKAVPNSLIAIEGNRISHLGPAGAAMRPETADDIVIDAAGKFILPGLIDAHCHISLHQGALPGARYTSSAEFCTLWAAHAIGRVLRAGVTEHRRSGRQMVYRCDSARGGRRRAVGGAAHGRCRPRPLQLRRYFRSRPLSGL